MTEGSKERLEKVRLAFDSFLNRPKKPLTAEQIKKWLIAEEKALEKIRKKSKEEWDRIKPTREGLGKEFTI